MKYIKCLIFSTLIFSMGSNEIHSNQQKEVWAYLMEHELNAYTGKENITDLCFFSARISYKGNLYRLKRKPNLPKLKKNIKTHLVVAQIGNPTLMYLILQKDSSFQKKLISDIVVFSNDYDGVQIDFEGLMSSERDNYTFFLKQLKSKLDKNKILSVALPAKTRYVKNAYDYKEIGSIVDKVLIMAYDQHWSTSKPGPVASADWGLNILKYSLTKINRSKIIMGIPFYGRSWESYNNTKAVRYSYVRELIKRRKLIKNGHNESNPNIKYDAKISVTIYFETIKSILKKVRQYKKENIAGVGFWRISMEPDGFWPLFSEI